MGGHILEPGHRGSKKNGREGEEVSGDVDQIDVIDQVAWIHRRVDLLGFQMRSPERRIFGRPVGTGAGDRRRGRRGGGAVHIIRKYLE